MNDDTHNERPLRAHLSDGDESPDPIPESPESGNPPSLDAAFEDDSARERLYSVLVQTREPTHAADIAERAGCHPDTARKYLGWFAQLGIAVKYEGHPTTFERNEAYFEWRYVTELAAQHALEDLQERSQLIQNRLDAYREEYEADDPSLVDAREIADETTGIDEVWSDLATWSTLEDELRLHERARQRLMERPNVEAVRG